METESLHSHYFQGIKTNLWLQLPRPDFTCVLLHMNNCNEIQLMLLKVMLKKHIYTSYIYISRALRYTIYLRAIALGFFFLFSFYTFILISESPFHAGTWLRYKATKQENLNSAPALGTKAGGWPCASHLFSALGSRQWQTASKHFVMKTAERQIQAAIRCQHWFKKKQFLLFNMFMFTIGLKCREALLKITLAVGLSKDSKETNSSR